MKFTKVKRILTLVLATTLIMNGNMMLPAQAREVYANSTVESRSTTAVIEISTEKDLKKIANNLDGNYKLKNDITLSGKEWTSIGRTGEGGGDIFNGTLDGAGYTISNLYSTAGNGLFVALGEDAVVKNLTISGKITTVANNTGLLAYLSMGTITDCTSEGSIKQPKYKGGSCNIGGLVANNEGYMKNCVNKATIAHTFSDTVLSQSAYGFVGGITGANNGTMENCINQGTVTTKCMYSGGITGVNKYLIKDCTNAGNVTAKLDMPGIALAVGGITGYNKGMIDSCVNTGSIIADAQEYQYDLGGIAGCTRVGAITTFMEYITDISTNTTEINNCENKGTVKGYQGYIGGICGNVDLDKNDIYDTAYVSNKGSIIISRCKNSGNIINLAGEDAYSGGTWFGGVIGRATTDVGRISILGCSNTADITSINGGNCGGVAASIYVSENDKGAEIFIKNCYNTGDITCSKESGYVAGISVHPTENVYLENIYNTGILTGANVLNSIGSIYVKSIKNCYFLKGTTNVEAAHWETALTADEMKIASSFKGFDFNYVWEMQTQNGVLLPSIKGIANPAKAALNSKSLKLELDKTTTLKASVGTLVHLYSGNPKIVSISNEGKITAKRQGSTVIYAAFLDGQIVRCPVTVVKGNVSNAKISLSKTSYEYNGSAKKPTVTVKSGDNTLIKNTDYTVTYSNNKNIGKATVIIKGKGNYTGTVKKTFNITVKKGRVYKVDKNKYKITSSSTVAFTGISNKKAIKFTVPKTVTIGGKKFNVTSVGTSAFEGCTKLSKVTIGSNVTSIGAKAFKGCKVLKSVTIPSKVTTIGKEAFRNCSKLSTITIKSTKLKSVGKNALKGIKSTAKIKVPSKKLSSYKKLMKKKGQGSKVKIVKYK